MLPLIRKILSIRMVLLLLVLPGASAQGAPVDNEDPEAPLLDPMAPTHVDVRARGPGPVDDAHATATIHHNRSTVGLETQHTLHLAPTTGSSTLDAAAKETTEGLPGAGTLWGWSIQHESQDRAMVPLE